MKKKIHFSHTPFSISTDNPLITCSEYQHFEPRRVAEDVMGSPTTVGAEESAEDDDDLLLNLPGAEL